MMKSFVRLSNLSILECKYFKKAKTNKMDFPTLKPDTDNIAKAVCDALNGVAYHDDKQITSLTVDKVWAEDGIERVEIDVEQLYS